MMEYRIRPKGRLFRSISPTKKLAPNEVRVKIRAVSLNHRDKLIADGNYPVTSDDFVLCSDGAGYIIETGAQVTSFKIGDPVVTGFFQSWFDGEISPEKIRHTLGAGEAGALAEEVILPSEAVALIPKNIDYRDASCFPCAAVTAWNALFHVGKIGKGKSILVQGTGGVSMWSTILANAVGATSYLVSRNPSKASELKKAGALLLSSEWESDIIQRGGVDLVIDVVGGNINSSLKCLKSSGVVAIIGGLDSFEISFSAVELFSQAKRIEGVYVGSLAMLKNALNFCIDSNIRPIISEVFSFEEAPEAFDFFASGKHFGKVVIEMKD